MLSSHIEFWSRGCCASPLQLWFERAFQLKDPTGEWGLGLSHFRGQMDRTIKRWNFQLFKVNGTTDPQLFAVRLYANYIALYRQSRLYVSKEIVIQILYTECHQTFNRKCLQQKNNLLWTQSSILNCGIAMCTLTTILPQRLMSLLLNPAYKRKPQQWWEIWVLVSLERQHWVSEEIWSLL